MRICSLLPSATEIVFALGLEKNLFGVTHECDYPARAQEKTAVVKTALPETKTLSSAQTEEIISRRRAEGKSVYLIDERRLKEINPDIIITQKLCDVCAVSEDQVLEASKVLGHTPEILSLGPATVEEIMDSILEVGKATRTVKKAETLVESLSGRIESVREKLLRERYRPGVFCLEWLEPPYAAGHWVPEMVSIAGGEALLGKAGEPSFRTNWDEILKSSPDYMILMPCGFNIERTLDEIEQTISSVPQWNKLPAVRKGHCYIVDANSYFSSPSPRIVDGIETLAGILHPDIFANRLRNNPVLNLKNHFYLQTFLG